MKVSGVIFDKDGTLVDFHKVWIPAANSVIKRVLREYEIQETMENQELALNTIGVYENQIDPNGALAWKTYSEIAMELKPKLESMKEGICIDAKKLGEKLDEFFEEEILGEDNQLEQVADLLFLMDTLKKRNVKIGVATTDTYKSTISCLEKLEILPYFSFFCMDQMPIPMPPKPSGRIISQAAKYWEVSPDEILVVGDSPNDMKLAHNGGAIAVGVLSGVSKKINLKPISDYLIDSVADVPGLIRKLEIEE